MQLLRTNLFKQPNVRFSLPALHKCKQTEIDLKIVKSDALG